MYLIKQRIRAHLFVNFALYKYLIIIIIGEPTSKTLEKLRREQQKKAIIDMCSFYHTATI